MEKPPRSYWNLEMLVFEDRGNQSTLTKTSRGKDENQQQTQPTYDGPHWWEASGLTTASSLLSVGRHVIFSRLKKRCVTIQIIAAQEITL